MDFEISDVSLDQIETADHTFKITTPTGKTELAPSISAIGLLQPPVLIPKGRTYTVICGYRRIAAFASLNIASIPARVLHPDCPMIQCARIAIADNSLQRNLNVVEQSRAYALIRKFADTAASWLNIAHSAGVPASQSAMDRIMPVAGMPATLQEAIVEGSIALPIALHIHRLNEDDARSLGRFFRTITTGLNVQRELLEMLSEISLRDDVAIARLIEQEDVAAIMGNEASPAPQKVQELRLLFKSQRYPELNKAEVAYHQTLKSMRLDPRIQLQPPRFFEGKSYRLTLTIDSRRQLKSLQPQIEKLILHPDLLPE
jgi:ParB family chromosome partitioning protein